MRRSIFLFLLFTFSLSRSQGQTRLSDPNALAWFNGFGTFYFSPKTALYTEYQWRREGPVNSWQQSLTRVGVQQKFGKRVVGILGYGHIITFPYGEYPAGPHPVVEHRVWQQLSWDDAGFSGVSLNHRIRAEQRFIQRVPQAAAERSVDGYNFVNRVRYQLRATIPLSFYASAVPVQASVTSTARKTRTYLAAYDEIFVGFGKKVGQNIFDQNRIGILFGYVLDEASRMRVEGGYFNQTVQQGAEVLGKEVFQYNHGFILNAYYTRPPKAASSKAVQ